MVQFDWTIDYDNIMEIKVEDQVFHVSKMIPHDQKIAMAEEYAQMAVILDNSGLATYRNTDTVLTYLKVKYYTDIDVSNVSPGLVHDYWIRHNLDFEITDNSGSDGRLHERDFEATKDICYGLADSVIDAWKTKFSLANLMNGAFTHQIEDTIAKSNLVNDEMIDLLEKASSKQEPAINVAQFPDFAKKKK